MLRTLFKILIYFFILSSLTVVAVLLYYYNSIRFDVDKAVYYNPKLTTQIYDRKGRLIANIFDKEHRIYAPIEEIPPRMIEALVAIEDTLFFEHNGINPDAIFRAMSKNIREGRIVEGASTLTQQLIKNLLLSREKTFDRKFKEFLLALRLETLLSKEEILERYLNENFFGHGYYGVKTASLGYFKKELDELSLKEIAILVGLPRAPSYYNPARNYEMALGRANKVLFRLKSLGWIDEQEFASALKEKPHVYDSTLTQNKAPYLVDMVLKELTPKIKDLRYGGYRINLTADLEYQELAKESLQYGYDRIQKRHKDDNVTATLNGAMVVMENKTGNLLAVVGGMDYTESSFNRAIQSRRQPGSSFKPFIYQVALNAGYSTISRIADISRTYEYTLEEEEKLWQPENYGKKFTGLTTIEEAVVHSINLATINLVNEIGFDNIYRNVETFGFKELPYNLSISLGSFGISPMQMSEMYSIFSNYGTKVKPRLISSIKNRLNQYQEMEYESEKVTSPQQSYLMVDVLKNVVKRGTGRSAQVKGLELAGKTGTTNNYVDAWFCGFSPSIQSVVWFGNDDNTPMGRRETGGGAPAPVFGYFYKKLLAEHPEIKRHFDRPEGVQSAKINGQEVLFTEISKPPKETVQQEEKLVF